MPNKEYNIELFFDKTGPQFLAPQVFLLGMPSCGKTSLCNKLVALDNGLADSYDGVKNQINKIFNRFICDVTDIEIGYCIVDFDRYFIESNVWKLFITNDCLFVIVIDSAANYEKDSIDYWLEEVAKCCGDNKRVFVVQNLTNNSSVKIIDRLDERYKKIVHEKNYEFNLKELNNKYINTSFQSFKQDLEDEMKKLYTELDGTSLKILKKIKLSKKVFISLDEYRNICFDVGEHDDQRQIDLLRKICMLGGGLWHENIGELRNMIFFDQPWLYKAVFSLLNAKLKEPKWEMSFSSIENVWSSDKYKHRIYDLLIILEKYKIIYKVEQANCYILNSNLNKNPLESFELGKIRYEQKRFINEYGIALPFDFISQLIVTFFFQIPEERTHVWENGLKVNSIQGPEATGVIELSHDHRSLTIWTSGLGAGLLMQQILNELWKVHKNVNIYPLKQVIPCNCIKCADSSKRKNFEYEEILIEIFSNRRHQIKCPYLNDYVSVESLLGFISTPKDKIESGVLPTEDSLKPMPQNKTRFFSLFNNINMGNKRFIIILICLALAGVVAWKIVDSGTGAIFKGGLDGFELTTESSKEKYEKKVNAKTYTVQVPIRINGEIPGAEQIGLMRSTHTLMTADPTSGGIFTFRRLKIPKDDILIFDLFYKNGNLAGSAQTSFAFADINNDNSSAVLNTVHFTGNLDKKRNQYVNIRVDPRFKVQIQNTNGDSNKTSQEQN